jgi:hypothetical protein
MLYRHFISLLVVITFMSIVLDSTATNAQQEESFEGIMIGLRANAVKGDVIYQRDDGKFPVESGLELEEGDYIRTGANAYAELLLDPGNYLRIGSDTDFQIYSEPHDKMRLKLNHGSISFEIVAHDWEGNLRHDRWQAHELIRVITPNGEVFINQPGIFRINTSSSGRTEVVTREGEAVLNGRRVKKRRRAVVIKDATEISEIDPKIEDAFDVWGRERADRSVFANRSLKKDAPWARKRKVGQEAEVQLAGVTGESKNTAVVSAKLGVVNFVEAGVEMSRAAKEWRQLSDKSQLEAGDTLRTSKHSYVELLLLPDMYLRLDKDSEISFEQLSNDAISLKLLRGAAILEAPRFNRKQSPQITLAAPSTSIVVAEKGNYRIDARHNSGEIIVRDGKVVHDERSVDGCHVISGKTVTDCDNRTKDNFDFWSEHRGEGETFIGRSRLVTASYLAGLRRGRFKDTGFWFQTPGQTDYVFVPFTSPRFRSPYGGHYSTVLAPRRMPLHRIDSRASERFPGPQIARPQP